MRSTYRLQIRERDGTVRNFGTHNLKIVSKYCRSLREAETYQNRLYGKYDSVKLVRSPVFNELGSYAWEVRQ